MCARFCDNRFVSRTLPLKFFSHASVYIVINHGFSCYLPDVANAERKDNNSNIPRVYKAYRYICN